MAAAGDPWMLSVGSTAVDTVPVSLASRVAVRSFDVLVSVLGLLLLAPLMIPLAVAVKWDSPGPIFYGSPRYGRNGVMFKAWKFRSMRPGAAGELHRLMLVDPDVRAEYGEYHKLRDDPRLTRVGTVLRRTSLDELPQLLNILRGQMSVVGPRPNIEADAKVFGPALAVVLRVKPGLTGRWQVSGRNRLPIEERVAIEVDYARTRTLAGDIGICALTLVQLWRPGKYGAY